MVNIFNPLSSADFFKLITPRNTVSYIFRSIGDFRINSDSIRNIDIHIRNLKIINIIENYNELPVNFPNISMNSVYVCVCTAINTVIQTSDKLDKSDKLDVEKIDLIFDDIPDCDKFTMTFIYDEYNKKCHVYDGKKKDQVEITFIGNNIKNSQKISKPMSGYPYPLYERPRQEILNASYFSRGRLWS